MEDRGRERLPNELTPIRHSPRPLRPSGRRSVAGPAGAKAPTAYRKTGDESMWHDVAFTALPVTGFFVSPT